MFLVVFLGNYLVNNIAAGLASLVPAAQSGSALLSAQYITFAVLAAIVTGLMAWFFFWLNSTLMQKSDLITGVIFGVVGFVVAVLTAFVTGIAGVLLQTGSFSQVAQILPRFGPYLWNWTTLVLFCVWVLPSVLVGFLAQKRMSTPSAQPMAMGGEQTM